MGVFFDGGFDSQRQDRGRAGQGESLRNAHSGVTSGWNLVLSYGDLSVQSGYRTRVLGELQHLDSVSGLDPFLLLFDRNPGQFKLDSSSDYAAIPRAEIVRFIYEVETIRRKQPLRVVHAHNLYSATLALLARRFYGYRVVLDYHGRIPEEYVFLGKGGERSRRALEYLEQWVLENADHVIVVSRALGRYVHNRYKTPASKLSVIPCCADSNLFRIDLGLREQTRADLGLADSLICTHLGPFLEGYESELPVRIFSGIRERHPQAHLLTVTPNPETARTYIAKHLPAGSFTVISASHERVPALLNATDLGFLLLRSSPNIETASPLKFAEYLNCGVPVIITNGVGDFSSLVANRRLGEVLSQSRVSEKLLQAVLHSKDDIAQRCVQSGQELTWQFHRDTAKYVF